MASAIQKRGNAERMKATKAATLSTSEYWRGRDEDAGDDADDGRRQVGQDRQQQRARQPLRDQFAHVPLVGEGEAEAPLRHHVADPDIELEGEGLVEAVTLAEEFGLGFGLLFGCAALLDEEGLIAVGVVSGRQLDNDKAYQRDAQDNGNGDGRNGER